MFPCSLVLFIVNGYVRVLYKKTLSNKFNLFLTRTLLISAAKLLPRVAQQLKDTILLISVLAEESRQVQAQSLTRQHFLPMTPDQL